MFSDLLRLKLLAKYGGVWADATLLCSTPLDHWVHLCDAVRNLSGYQRPRRERTISSWFVAACPESIMIEKLLNEFETYLQKTGVKAYFAFHYIFEYLVRSNLRIPGFLQEDSGVRSRSSACAADVTPVAHPPATGIFRGNCAL